MDILIPECAVGATEPGQQTHFQPYSHVIIMTCSQKKLAKVINQYGNDELAIIIIIEGHSLRRACLQPATNTQNSKPRPPTSNARSKLNWLYGQLILIIMWIKGHSLRRASNRRQTRIYRKMEIFKYVIVGFLTARASSEEKEAVYLRTWLNKNRATVY